MALHQWNQNVDRPKRNTVLPPHYPRPCVHGPHHRRRRKFTLSGWLVAAGIVAFLMAVNGLANFLWPVP
ncbi:MAG: hypothetical protein Q8R28_19295 [Dehalococcoidia bacterium]|nr:hypothetical protein [Dehalococcoidia bacterium]